MTDQPYEPFDQDRRLSPPPWNPADPAVRAWEAAHGHDVRLKCYVEFGCQVIEPTLETEVERLRQENKRLRGELRGVQELLKIERAEVEMLRGAAEALGGGV